MKYIKDIQLLNYNDLLIIGTSAFLSMCFIIILNHWIMGWLLMLNFKEWDTEGNGAFTYLLFPQEEAYHINIQVYCESWLNRS